MIFFEHFDLDINHPYSIYTVKDIEWGTHFHQNFECIFALSGEAYCTVEQQEYVLKPGNAVMVMPHQPHAFRTPERSQVIILLFLPEIVSLFYNDYINKKPDSNCFQADGIDLEAAVRYTNRYQITGFLYTLCGTFSEQTAFRYRAAANDALIDQMMQYIEANYSSACSLTALSAALGYDYNYLSKIFLRHTGFTYVAYLNHRRVTCACSLIRNTDDTFLTIASACGFGSLRSFNRVFLQLCHCTPSAYRQGRSAPETRFSLSVSPHTAADPPAPRSPKKSHLR